MFYFIAPVVSWLSAQTIKYITNIIKNRAFHLFHIVKTGGMPSSHTSLVVTLIIQAALIEGVNSIAFATALVFGLIVIYDAMSLRRAVGYQGSEVEEMYREYCEKHGKEYKSHKPVKGHTLLEIIGGVVWGALIAFLFNINIIFG